MTKQKRGDIQGLRSIAICGVLLFHLAPKRFINGFLGVDMFFVLSGYLMSSILSREEKIDGAVVRGFYIRRFKRIVPLYSIMLGILTAITPLVFLPSDMPHFITDLEWALPFAENMQNVLKSVDYWDEVFSSPVLLHAWSLGVEIQYYLVVPFIMIVARGGDTRRSRMSAFLCFIGVSYTIHIFSSTTVSFGLLFARVWQFLTGSIFFELEGVLDEPATGKEYQALGDQTKLLDECEEGVEETVKGEVTEKRSFRCHASPLISIISYCITAYLLWMVVMSTLGSALSRLLVTLASGCALLLGKYTQNAVLSNEVMVYIGDLSYLVYLAHWPVIILYKYYSDVADLSLPDMSLCLLLTLLISVLLHHSLERFFIASSTTVSAIFVAGVYTLMLVVLIVGGMQSLSEYAHRLGGGAVVTTPKSIVGGANGTTPKTVTFDRAEAIQWNQQEMKLVYFMNPDGCVRDFEAERWTGVSGEGALRCVATGNGTAKVLVMGNSYGYRAFPVLHRLFAGRYAQMRMFTKSSRTFITFDKKTTDFSRRENRLIEHFQPDITFLIEKDTFQALTSPIIEEDPITQYMQTVVDHMSNNSGIVVIDRQYYKPGLADGAAYMIQKRLQQDKSDFNDLSVSKKDYMESFSNETARMATIKNDNVIINNVQEQLCPGDQCYFYNRANMHAFYGDKFAHLTSEGLKQLEPKYSEIIEDFLLRMAQKTKPENNIDR